MTQAHTILPDGNMALGTRDDAVSATPASLGGLILSLATALILLGVVMVFSARGTLDRPLFPEDPLHSIAARQIAFALLAIVLMWITYGVGYRCLRWRSPTLSGDLLYDLANQGKPAYQEPAVLLLVLVLVALVAVLIPGLGDMRRHARRWLQFGPSEYGLGFQPSELAKLGMVVFLAAWLTHRRVLMKQFRNGILPPILVLGALAGLIVIEDLGTAALIVLVGGLMILAAGARLWHAGLLAIPGLAAFGGMIWIEPYRIERLLGFRNVWADPLDKGYHAVQSLVAIASGGWWGRGLGAGMQKYGYLPEAHTDFIFAIICEELGLVGGLTVMAMFVCLVLLGWRVMVSAPDSFGKLLALGITLMLGFQAAMNIAVVTVSVPTKGISLPLVSAGGSGVILFAVALALLASVSRASSRGADSISP